MFVPMFVLLSAKTHTRINTYTHGNTLTKTHPLEHTINQLNEHVHSNITYSHVEKRSNAHTYICTPIYAHIFNTDIPKTKEYTSKKHTLTHTNKHTHKNTHT